ncbi:MAG: F0F1 ATP synthase subunit B [Alphaproteobacteria bacterium]|nr:F0F1 ATP synthase subunit B [Alphaproteobacteria bacterium]
MEELIDNPYFWSALAFAVFLLLALRYGRKPLFGWLDGEIAKIREELEQAKNLRAEAEGTLDAYRKKQAEAQAEAEQIVAQARRAAESLRIRAEGELKDQLARREQQAMERIALAESEALRDVRAAAIDMAVQATAQVLAQKLDSARAGKLIDEAIAELPNKLGKKISDAA